MAATDNELNTALKSEIMLQINQALLERGLISREVYDAATAQIVSQHPGA